MSDASSQAPADAVHRVTMIADEPKGDSTQMKKKCDYCMLLGISDIFIDILLFIFAWNEEQQLSLAL
jgi:hypothetical protein